MKEKYEYQKTRNHKSKEKSSQLEVRQVATYRIMQERHLLYKKVCKKYKLSHCLMTEVLIEKFLRGEILITQKDFDYRTKKS